MPSAGGHREGGPATATVFKNLAMVLSTTRELWFMNPVPALFIRNHLSHSEQRVLTPKQIKVSCRLRSSYLLPAQIRSLEDYEQMDKLCRFFPWVPQLVKVAFSALSLFSMDTFSFCFVLLEHFKVSCRHGVLPLNYLSMQLIIGRTFLTIKSFRLLFRLILNFPNGSNHVLLSDALIVPYLWSSPTWSKPVSLYVHLGVWTFWREWNKGV